MLKITIDPGHGGTEPGTSANGYVEKDLNLQVSLLLKTELERSGIEVIMTRTTDVFMTLSDRSLKAIETKSNALISVHFNSFNTAARGTETIYSFFNPCLASSKWIAECVLEETVKLGTIKRSAYTKESGTSPGHNYYGVLRNLEPIPGIIAEGLFLDNAEDIKLLKQDGFLKKLAIAYAKGICRAYGLTYIAETATPVKPVEIPKIFADWNNIADYAKESVKLMRDLGLMSGDDKGNFNPTLPLTRQDFAVIIAKMIKGGMAK